MELSRKHLWYLVIFFPILVFFGIFFFYMINVPINDDYALLDFINKYVTTSSFYEKVKLIFAQHNEHRIVYDRIWTIISYKTSGNLNFTLLALIGNLSLIGITVIFFKKFKKLGKELLLFLPITVIIFNISNWENITFSMATLSNFTVIYFALMSLYFLCSDTFLSKKNLFLSVLFFILAVLTQGGGMFLFPLSLLILIYKKEYKNVMIYLALSLPIIFIYFYDYTSPGSIGFTASIVEYNFKIIPFIFAFLGNAFNYYLIYSDNINQSSNTAIFSGIVLLILFFYITYKQYYKQNLFIYSVLLFFIISACATSVSRVSFGIDAAGASRYRINGIIFVVAIYFWLIESFNLKKLQISLILIFTLSYLYFVNLMQVQYLDIRKKQTYTGVLMYNIGNSSFLNGDKNDTEIYNSLLNKSKELNTYNLPLNEEILDYFPFSNEHLPRQLKTAPNDLAYNIDSITELNDSYLIEGWAFIGEENTKNQKIYIGITNNLDNKIIYYSTKSFSRYDLNSFFKKNNLSYGGYLGRVRKNDLKVGENKISLMIEVNGTTKTVLTDKKTLK